MQLQCKAEVSGNNHIMVSQRKCLRLCSEMIVFLRKEKLLFSRADLRLKLLRLWGG